MTYMKRCFELAQQAFDHDEVPVGALIVKDGVIIATAANAMCHTNDATAHAEILCIRHACAVLARQFLTECDLYVTLEPCPMCAGAIAQARIRRVYFGAYDPKGGAVVHGARVFDYSLHKPEVIGGVEEIRCSTQLTQFFASKRPGKKN